MYGAGRSAPGPGDAPVLGPVPRRRRRPAMSGAARRCGPGTCPPTVPPPESRRDARARLVIFNDGRASSRTSAAVPRLLSCREPRRGCTPACRWRRARRASGPAAHRRAVRVKPAGQYSCPFSSTDRPRASFCAGGGGADLHLPAADMLRGEVRAAAERLVDGRDPCAWFARHFAHTLASLTVSHSLYAVPACRNTCSAARPRRARTRFR